MATQNPIEYEGTYPLPEAQLDRFLVRLRIGYPTREEEMLILKRRKARGNESVRLDKVISAEQLLFLQQAVENVHIDDAVKEYVVDLVQATREHEHEEVGASPRGSLGLMRMASATALMRGRDYVLPDDVKDNASAVLSHRLILAPKYWVRGERPEAVIDALLNRVPVPKVD
jgi:MoxR-like ATPase